MAVDEINKRGGVNVKGKKYTITRRSPKTRNPSPSSRSAARSACCATTTSRSIFGILTSGPGMAAATAFGKSDVLYFGGFTLMDTLLGKPGGELMIRTLNNDATVAKSFVPDQREGARA